MVKKKRRKVPWYLRKRKKKKLIFLRNLAEIGMSYNFVRSRKSRRRGRIERNRKTRLTFGSIWRKKFLPKEVETQQYVTVLGLYRRDGICYVYTMRAHRRAGGWRLYQNSKRGGWYQKHAYWMTLKLFKERYAVTRAKAIESLRTIYMIRKLCTTMSELELLPL